MKQFTSFLFGSQKDIDLFDINDVSANRMGYLSPAQEKRLNAAAMGGGLKSIAGPFFILPVIAFFFFFLFLSSSNGWVFLIPIIILVIVAIFLSRPLLNWFLTSRKLKIDRDNKTIRSAMGELAFDRKKGYYVQVGEEKLRLPPSTNMGGLVPGLRYNFYYLPESRFVASAEQVGIVNNAQTRVSLTKILSEANDFTLDDLQANQQNEISSGQRSRGIRKTLSNLLPFLFFGGIFLVSFLPELLSGNKTNDPTSLFISAAILIGVFGFGAWNAFNALLDLTTSTPEMLEGTGSTITRQKSSGRSRRTAYYYVIGDKEFEVNSTAYQALISGQQYRIYYTPRTNHLLSIEATGGSDNPFNY